MSEKILTHTAEIVRQLSNGRLLTVLNDSFINRIARQACRVMDVEFLHQTGAMFLHRFDADAKIIGNLLVGMAFSHQL